jgi:hypothetical protein
MPLSPIRNCSCYCCAVPNQHGVGRDWHRGFRHLGGGTQRDEETTDQGTGVDGLHGVGSEELRAGMGAVRSTLSFRRRLSAACRLKTLRPIRQFSFVTSASEPHRPRAQSHDRLHYASSLICDAVSSGKDHLKQKYDFIRDYDDNKRRCYTASRDHSPLANVTISLIHIPDAGALDNVPAKA